jgi:hypothetical protein
MSGGKTSGNQEVQYTDKQSGEGSVVATRVTRLPAAKQARGKGKTEADKVLAADAFAAALDAVPAEDWCRTWAAGKDDHVEMDLEESQRRPHARIKKVWRKQTFSLPRDTSS